MNKRKQQTYEEFLESKIKRFQPAGFEIKESELNPHLFDFQRYVVKTALRKGRYAVFADCGLGKTLMQLDWAQKVSQKTGKPVLILAPLAVSGQTIEEGVKFGIRVEKYDCQLVPGVYITNYEQIHNIDCSLFGGVCLDESSILKNFTGVYKNILIQQFQSTPYKLCCTATPSPNDVMELGNHAEFLGIMNRTEMLAMYFIHDAANTSEWKLKGHAEGAFWSWVASWAVMFSKPSDIGFSAEGYELPEINFIERQIQTPNRGDGLFFNMMAVNATNFNQELRLTQDERLKIAAEIVNKSDENFIVWIKQNEEADALLRLIPDAVEVRGSESPEAKERKLLGFARNEFRVLLTKTKIAMFGMNYQNCRNQVFASLDFSFEGLYQAVRRSYRFGQKQEVNIYLITTDTMQNVVESVKRKERQFMEMQSKLTAMMNEVPVEAGFTTDKTEYQSEHAHLLKGDCVRLIKTLKDESIGFSIFSPPFAELYTYSDKLEDMGNSKDYKEFLFAFGLLIEDLFRVIQSGRNVAVHCMDLPIQKSKEGFIGLRDFSNLIRETFERSGFIYHSRVTIWKDPVTEMQRTKALGLLHKQVKKDAAMSRVGLPDYLLVFRKPGEHRNPVRCDIPVETWQKYASPVWYDINYGKTLNAREGRTDERDEKHICPLQLETIERAVHLWTNEGDTVLTPFMGIGSEVYQAVKMNRKGIGFELKDSYFLTAIKNVQVAEEQKKQGTLFGIAA